MPDELRTERDTDDRRSPREMNLVEIASELESITSTIERERTRERDARAEYQAIADDVAGKVREVRMRAKALVDEQRRRMSGFDGIINRPSGHVDRVAEVKPRSGGRFTMPDAILAIWDLERYNEPLSSDEISAALSEVGYHSNAAPKSLKSSVNQTIAKLCNSGKLGKYLSDGTPLAESQGVRARKYMPLDLG